MSKINNNSFVFYESWYEVLEDERQEVQWEIIHAIMEYVFRGNLVELKPNAKMAFKFIKRDIDRAKDNYNSFINKQVENGKKGGAKAGNQNAKKTTQNNPNDPNDPTVEKTTQTSLKEKDNVNEKVKDNVKDILLEKEPKEKLDMPIEFEPIWSEWLEYRKARKLKNYASAKYEQIAVNKLIELSENNFKVAREILEQSYTNNYQGFFPLKNRTNGTNNNQYGFSTNSGNSPRSKSGKTSARTILAKRLSAENESFSDGSGGNFTVDAEIVE